MKSILLLTSIVLLCSCEKNQQLTYSEKHTIGTWQYDDVNFTKRWTIGNKDVTSDFEYLTMMFNADFTAKMLDQNSGESYSGIWEVNRLNTYNSQKNANTCTEQLVVSLKNDVSGEIIQLVWDNLSFTGKKMRSTNNTKDGCFTYRLRKI